MDRRGFLGSLVAVTTAIASGLKLPTGAEVATGKAMPKPLAVQNDLLAILEECHVTSITQECTYDGPMQYEVEYIHAPGGGKKQEHTLLVDKYTNGMRPVDVRYAIAAGEVMRVTVTWV
jgi:hypothetical protein